MVDKETESPKEAPPKEDKNEKVPLKKAAASKVVMLPPKEPIHAFFEAYKLSSLLNPTKGLEDLLMTLSIDQIKFMEGVLSRIKKRKNYHLKRANTAESSLSFTPSSSIAEPDISLNISLPPNKYPKLMRDLSALGELPTPSLSTSNTSPPCAQIHPTGLIDHSASNISVKKNGEIWMQFKAKGSDISHHVCVDIDLCHTEQELIAAEFSVANSLISNPVTQAEKDLNLLGLRLAFLNPDVLANNKPLLQEATNAFQMYFPGMFSFQMGDFNPSGLLSSSSQPLSNNNSVGLNGAMVVNVHANGISTCLFLRADLESVNLDNLTEDFKKENCVFPHAFEQSSKGVLGDKPRLEIENVFNEWGWKLAFLNPVDLAGNLPRLQCALDTYRNTFTPLSTRPSAMLTLPTVMQADPAIDISSFMLDPQFLSMMTH
ncbi:hypothetical protein DSO57_1006759 [Entomophthora muscae]|uniref:Uncharacterized protein n=1 Tax=Entomophthora muscae TaxID=34485 RepID=A0ACC2RMF2_9FUNG|nr:hypothetical protein DSO57_1006759 [Entomophthora muscae]